MARLSQRLSQAVVVLPCPQPLPCGGGEKSPRERRGQFGEQRASWNGGSTGWCQRGFWTSGKARPWTSGTEAGGGAETPPGPVKEVHTVLGGGRARRGQQSLQRPSQAPRRRGGESCASPPELTHPAAKVLRGVERGKSHGTCVLHGAIPPRGRTKPRRICRHHSHFPRVAAQHPHRRGRGGLGDPRPRPLRPRRLPSGSQVPVLCKLGQKRFQNVPGGCWLGKLPGE